MTDQARAELESSMIRFGEAWAKGDRATVDALLSPGYTHIDIYGAFHDRASWLDYAAGRSGRATTIGFRDVVTRIFGDVAIVTGINDIRGSGIRDAADEAGLTLRFTQVWVRRSGQWVREAFQATPIRTETAR
jgi:ketosteroid isomerase-like protein